MLYVENEQKPTKGITSPVRLELTTSGLEVQRAIHCAKETYLERRHIGVIGKRTSAGNGPLILWILSVPHFARGTGRNS